MPGDMAGDIGAGAAAGAPPLTDGSPPGAGAAACVGCAEPNFWDRMTPFYAHLPGVPGFGVHSNIDQIGLGATALVGAAFAAQGIAKVVQQRVARGAGSEEPGEPGGDPS